MKRTHNKAVAELWVQGKPARSNSMMTDGETLFSYTLPIGVTEKPAGKVVIDYTSKSGHRISQSTSQHVGYASGCESVTLRPPTKSEWSKAKPQGRG